MIIGVALMVLLILIFFNLILGQDFIGDFVPVGDIDSSVLVDGVSSTFVQEAENIFFYIDTTSLVIAGISILTTIIIVASITGISVLGSGLNPQSSKIIVVITAYIGLWFSLSVLAFSLIISIPVFGTLIYIGITIGYSIGVIQKISGGD